MAYPLTWTLPVILVALDSVSLSLGNPLSTVGVAGILAGGYPGRTWGLLGVVVEGYVLNGIG